MQNDNKIYVWPNYKDRMKKDLTELSTAIDRAFSMLMNGEDFNGSELGFS